MKGKPMSNKEAVKQWRKSTKERIVQSMGGKCQICGYDKCDDALELHHINPEEKEFGLGAIRANPISWKRITEELRKCILVCSNCHREVHADITKLPNKYRSFDESFIDYKVDKKLLDECLVCGNEKPIKNKFCSLSCAAKKSGKVDWDSIDLKELLKSNTYTDIGRIVGVTGAAVKKRAVKLKLVAPSAGYDPATHGLT